MAREGLRYELNLMFGNALRQKGAVTKKGLSVTLNGETQVVNLTVRLLEKPDALRGLVLIVFADFERVDGGTVLDPALSADTGETGWYCLSRS